MKNNNELQRAQGLNLKKYQGKSAMKYTYLLEEYPGLLKGARSSRCWVQKIRSSRATSAAFHEVQFYSTASKRKRSRDTLPPVARPESSAVAE